MATNGRLPASDLGTIPGTTRRLRRDLIAQTAALRDAFEARFGKPLVITDAYRDYATQERIFRQRYTTTYLPGRPSKVWNGRRWWQKAGTAMAATPGTSNHGLGQAIDFGSRVNVRGSAEHNWMRENGPRYGWTWPSWWAQAAGEWWHFEATPVPASNYRPGGGSVPSVPDLNRPDPLTPEDDMAWDDVLSSKTGATAKASTFLTETNRAAFETRDGIEYVKRQNLALEAQHKALDQRIVVQTRAVSAEVRTAVDAVAGNLTKAIAAVNRGEPFDEAKLLAGIRESARAGTAAAAPEVSKAAADAVRSALADVEGVTTEQIESALRSVFGSLGQ